METDKELALITRTLSEFGNGKFQFSFTAGNYPHLGILLLGERKLRDSACLAGEKTRGSPGHCQKNWGKISQKINKQ